MKNTFEKLILLQTNQNGFDSTQFLTTKANATIDFETEKNRLTKSQNPSASTGNKGDLYGSLKVWRDTIANEKNVEKYMIVAQKTLQNLSEEMPRNKAELSKISGFGTIKIKQYGDEILDIINEFCEVNGIENNKIQEGIKVVKKKIVKGSTQELSYAMFKEGKTIVEIAEIRGFAASTIEGHLGEYVKNGLLAVEDVLEKKKVKIIREFIVENPALKGTVLKEALGEDYSYSEIRMVWSSMNVEVN